ncbi:hypothetical protein SMICM304S_05247 [Streptomyces microflavus]
MDPARTDLHRSDRPLSCTPLPPGRYGAAVSMSYKCRRMSMCMCNCVARGARDRPNRRSALRLTASVSTPNDLLVQTS